MPLRYTDDPAAPESVQDVAEKYVIFYASRGEDGKMWCPDCVEVEDVVEKKFAGADGPSGLIVRVGQRAEWKTPKNPFRGEPWKVGSIPTIIRVEDGARLVLDEIRDGLASF
ncbi:hypothetical protein BDW22DRAFT_1424485 [Trametopsis cervina]|nr:hypothetical protein BDW22DRAFT_1424485 [Trametopsis cervina]